MTSSATLAAAPGGSATASKPPYFLADLYTFKWSALCFRVSAISASAVALCLIVGIGLGHPGGALVAAGGALTIGFGANQRISDSRLLPMIFAVLAMASATLAGTLVGHRGLALLAASAVAAAIYGILTVRHSGLAWVGQQAAIALFVASAFPTGPKPAFERAGLILAGGIVQIVITSAGLQLFPELREQVAALPRTLRTAIPRAGGELVGSLHRIPAVLPQPDSRTAVIYSLRLVVTVTLASELYRRLGMQSGYWVPMTALLVQKPAFAETVSRALARVGGTVAGASLATLLASYFHVGPWMLAALATFFAFWCYVTNSVNYALFSVAITSYIVFLLSLNQIPGPELAHRRAWCTAAGALIALLIHLDGIRRHRNQTAPGAKPHTTQ